MAEAGAFDGAAADVSGAVEVGTFAVVLYLSLNF